MNGIKLIILMLLSTFLMTPALSSEKEAGKALLTKGSVTSIRDGKNVALMRRSLIYVKDEIRVGAKARAQFRMVDQAIISLQENSIFKINQYKFGQGVNQDSAFLELLSGGLRTITGAIGKGNKKAYELRTPLATIGIRGTDYEVEIVSNGMFVAVWDGIIHVRSHIKNGCNLLLGRSQAYMFAFIDRLGNCKGLQEVPDIFSTGYSSGHDGKSTLKGSGVKSSRHNKRTIKPYLVGKSLQTNELAITPLLQRIPTTISNVNDSIDTDTNDTNTNGDNDPQNPLIGDNPPTQDPIIPLDPADPLDPGTPIPNLPIPPALTFDFSAFTIDQTRPSVELNSRASALGVSLPIFSVGLNTFENINNSDSEFQQSVGGYQVSWGYWGEFSSSLLTKNVTNPSLSGLLWASYEATDPDIVAARTGSFSRYDNITDSLLSGSQSEVRNLQVQMDVNFDTGNITNGALSANTSSDTWVAVFDGKIQSGDLDLQMNGASVIDSNPNTPSPTRDVSGFIAGDFVGENAEGILGSFGLSEDTNSNNHIEGVFIIEERN